MARPDQLAESFWRFSLLVYGRPGVADALLRLQDQGGHNVNLILFGLWLGWCEATRLDAAGVARGKAAIDPLDRDVIGPLRALRRALKGDPDADIRDLRQRVLALEIAAERRVQARLAAGLPRRRKAGGDRRALTEANLRLILGRHFGSDEAAFVLAAVEADVKQ